ncbi:MAG: transcription-repair coupling factor [Rickettsiaceae bacterium]
MPSIKLPINSILLYLNNYLDRNLLLITSSEQDAIHLHDQLSFFVNSNEDIAISYFPSFDNMPYDMIAPNSEIAFKRSKVLTFLAKNKTHTKQHQRNIVITNSINLLSKLTPIDVMAESKILLKKNKECTVEKLSAFLNSTGWNKVDTSFADGEFSIKGEIIDIVIPSSNGYRINIAWDKIESIRKYDVNTQISYDNIDQIEVNSASEIIPKFNNLFKSNYIKHFGIKNTKCLIYESITENLIIPQVQFLLPLFYSKTNSLIDYLHNPLIVYDNMSIHNILAFEKQCQESYESRVNLNKANLNSFYPVLSLTELYTPASYIKGKLYQEQNIEVLLGDSDNTNVNSKEQNTIQESQMYAIPNIIHQSYLDNTSTTSKFIKLIDMYRSKIVIICGQSKSNLIKIQNILSSNNYHHQEIHNIFDAKYNTKIVYIVNLYLSSGFISDKYLIISDLDIFRQKNQSADKNQRSAKSSQKKLRGIMSELNNFNQGDLVVHKNHGIGIFNGIESIKVENNTHDFLNILYADNDKLYIPVENINVIKIYGNKDAELDKLGAKTWHRRLAKTKEMIHSAAKKFISMSAKRKLAKTHSTEFDIEAYNEFAKEFPFIETQDQLDTIDNITQDLKLGSLMDRLICGDVGFGKTEVAMRASYMVCMNNNEILPQVVIVVPTTILCKQHLKGFRNRFANTNIKVCSMSRMLTAKELRDVKEQIKNGQVQIIIATHAILAKNIDFYNLKLLVIDEEHRFGVTQKDKLKNLSSGVHFLSLSATPIPRSLQMSIVGIRDLSLISTPPISRLALNTKVIIHDLVIIRDALLREYNRGGKSFYICPKIKDIPKIEYILQTIVPDLNYKIAHGKMNSSSIDDVMIQFCEVDVDILISTTIVESGIDIPIANTIIIHNADKLGLSQLYQLRGRIGRSNIQAYAYLILSENSKITQQARKRLEIMQNSSYLGSGFSIASHDMDIRGFGNLLGDKQSGQIKEIGIELYQDMLAKQIEYLTNSNENQSSLDDKMEDNDSISINLNLPVFISEMYISEQAVRLGIYKRIGNLINKEEVKSFRSELVDRFGPIPSETQNLLEIILIKQRCKELHITNIDSGNNGFVIKFNNNANARLDNILKFIQKNPNNAKIKPNNKLIFQTDLSKANEVEIINAVHSLLNSI